MQTVQYLRQTISEPLTKLITKHNLRQDNSKKLNTHNEKLWKLQ